MTYPNNQYLISLAELKAYTGITGTTSDSLLTNLIHSVQDAVEVYLDRRLMRWTYQQWFEYDRALILPQWPVNNVFFIGTPVNCVTIADSTNSYTFNINQTNGVNPTIIPQLTVTNGYTLVSQNFPFATYTNLAQLKVAVEAACAGVTLTLVTSPTYNWPDMNTLCLRAGSGLNLYGAVRQNVLYRIDDGTNRTLIIPQDVIVQFNALDYWFETSLLVIWDAGYDQASVPTGLKQIISDMCDDYLNLSKINGGGLIKSETIKNYSYTLADTSTVFDIVKNHSSDLEPYRKKLV